MLQRVMPELMGMKNIVVLNDEAHHCYGERVKDATGETEDNLKGEEKEEAKENNKAGKRGGARLGKARAGCGEHGSAAEPLDSR